METVVYVLCGVTAIACAILLFRSWLTGRARLLLWATICFVGLALNNIVLFLDKEVVTDTSFATLRTVPACVGLAAFALGLVWEEGRPRG
jgi:hypothetical protein